MTFEFSENVTALPISVTTGTTLGSLQLTMNITGSAASEFRPVAVSGAAITMSLGDDSQDSNCCSTLGDSNWGGKDYFETKGEFRLQQKQP